MAVGWAGSSVLVGQLVVSSTDLVSRRAHGGTELDGGQLEESR